ncbi:hypothetical protein [Leptolyngbya sp. GGD]|uniref:hypothetical protein n=1 Tax=Leptolyngbya sp. GGD TaxID=2997907 RepID=UPI00227CA9FB|nr:hypothetical protein [Leptolyngbya sp. GGD]MCY6493837.1 hypothetical protein [Leptolyngbya sp. GGD]
MQNVKVSVGVWLIALLHMTKQGNCLEFVEQRLKWVGCARSRNGSVVRRRVALKRSENAPLADPTEWL